MGKLELEPRPSNHLISKRLPHFGKDGLFASPPQGSRPVEVPAAVYMAATEQGLEEERRKIEAMFV